MSIFICFFFIGFDIKKNKVSLIEGLYMSPPSCDLSGG